MTKFVKNSDIKNDWYEIDANGAIVGRLAVVISKIIRGLFLQTQENPK